MDGRSRLAARPHAVGTCLPSDRLTLGVCERHRAKHAGGRLHGDRDVGRDTGGQISRKTSSTAGVDVGVGMAVAEICPGPFAAEPAVPAGAMPWQALSRRLKATRAAAQPPPDRDLADGAFTSYRLSGHGRWPMLHRTPREAGHIDKTSQCPRRLASRGDESASPLSGAVWSNLGIQPTPCASQTRVAATAAPKNAPGNQTACSPRKYS